MIFRGSGSYSFFPLMASNQKVICTYEKKYRKAKGKPISPVLLFSKYRICNGLRKGAKKKVPKIKKIIKVLATKYPSVLVRPQIKYTINPNIRQRSAAKYKIETACKNGINDTAEMDAARIRTGRKSNSIICECNKNAINP